ncbi:MAG TPA: hypothetical protein VGH42_14340 [Verrucomicrobiae bacterium]|jgi:hypothetical protein
MPSNPQTIAADTNTVINAWTTLAPAASFGGMTLAQYKTKVQPSFDARTAIDGLNAQMTAAMDTRDDADGVTSDTNQMVIKGVVGDPNYGDDSNLYEAMGYVRKSERASGLTKKSNAAQSAAKK